MNFRQLLANSAPSKDTVLTVGVFDGVHLGHQHLLGHLLQLSTPSLLPTVLTFNNHPVSVLRPEIQMGYLTSPEHKVQLLRDLGIGLVVGLDFTWELSQVSAHDFVAALFDRLRMRGLVLGPDTALGHNREGDLEFLRQQGEQLGFWVESVEPLVLDGVIVKSREIRADIAKGDVASAARMLGRNFSIRGEVVLGDRRGRQLGFPTANMKPDGQMLLPGDGIYATWAIIDGARYPSATSIGVRPTFGLTERLVEVHVMDFNADIYGQQLSVEFVAKVRDQETFSTVDELIEKINQDVVDSRAVLSQQTGIHVG